MTGVRFIQQNAIAPGMSLYLDLIRFLAALTVVLYHTWHHFDSAAMKLPGHEAVVVFFVLSGYVIAHAASRPGITLGLYAQHRIARILPVAWTALLLAGVLAMAVPALDEESSLWGQTLANAVFIAQSGWGWYEAPLNSPFWSLNYEVWYYVIFATWVFVRKNRWLWLGVALLLAGPKILMLMPIWLMGVALYQRMPTFSQTTAWLIFIGTIVMAAAMCWLDVSAIWTGWLYDVAPPIWRAHYSTQVLYDMVLGIIVSANFAAICSLDASLQYLRIVERPIRYLASFTLSLYLFHAPLSELFLKVMKLDRPLPFYAAMAASIFLLAQLTERRTGWYRRHLAKLLAARSTAAVHAGP